MSKVILETRQNQEGNVFFRSLTRLGLIGIPWWFLTKILKTRVGSAPIPGSCQLISALTWATLGADLRNFLVWRGCAPQRSISQRPARSKSAPCGADLNHDGRWLKELWGLTSRRTPKAPWVSVKRAPSQPMLVLTWRTLVADLESFGYVLIKVAFMLLFKFN